MDAVNYVMVPVPEHLVPDVMRHVLVLMTKDAIERWDQPSIDEAFASVDELGRTILSGAARAQVTGERLTVDDLATHVGLPIGEVVNRIRALNESTDGVARPALVGIEISHEALPNGREARRRYVTMSDVIAEMVTEAEKAERSSVPHPLQGT